MSAEPAPSRAIVGQLAPDAPGLDRDALDGRGQRVTAVVYPGGRRFYLYEAPRRRDVYIGTPVARELAARRPYRLLPDAVPAGSSPSAGEERVAG